MLFRSQKAAHIPSTISVSRALAAIRRSTQNCLKPGTKPLNNRYFSCEKMTTTNRRRYIYDAATKSVVPCDHELPQRDAPGSNWHGYLSQSQSCHPKDVPMMQEHLRKSGISDAAYRPDGRLEVTSRVAQHRVAKAFDRFVNDDVR